VLNGGVGVRECYFCDSATFVLPNEPTKEGYSFVDWCIDSDFSAPFKPYDGYYYYGFGNERFFRITSTLKVTKDTTLYALWINGTKIYRFVPYNDPFSLAFKDSLLYREYLWVAYADEPGLYTNKTTGINYKDGRQNIGGDANDVCRSKRNGWYLPAKNERLYDGISTYVGEYWYSTESADDFSRAYYWVYNGRVITIGQQKTEPYRVRCVWRPLYDE